MLITSKTAHVIPHGAMRPGTSPWLCQPELGPPVGLNQDQFVGQWLRAIVSLVESVEVQGVGPEAFAISCLTTTSCLYGGEPNVA